MICYPSHARPPSVQAFLEDIGILARPVSMNSAAKYPHGAGGVSVLVPTYQHVRYIEQCLDGILMQRTSFPVEVLVGEDESADGTREICQRYAARYPDRIRLFLRERKDVIHIHGRPTGRSNFLRLLAEARGDHVAICEGDDYWTDPLKLQRQVEAMRSNEHWSACFHQVSLRFEAEPHEAGRVFPPGPMSVEYRTEDLLRPWFIPTCSLLFKRSSCADLPPWTRTTLSLDIPLILLSSLTGPIGLVEGVMGVYRIHGSGVSRNPEHHGYDKVRAMAYIYELFNVHTGYRYNDRIREAFVAEINAHLPEVKELNRMRTTMKESITVLDRVYYLLWVRLPFMRGALDRVFRRKKSRSTVPASMGS